MPPLDTSKLMNSIIFDSVRVRGALDNIFTSILSNSHFGKRFVAVDVTIFASHVALRT